jgi:ammonium transporter, Amt family
VYPVVVHWAWSNRGWLSAFRVRDPLFDFGYVDFAGSGVVHMVGGLSGLMGAIMVGPRLGRFDSNGKPVDMPGHSATLVVLGTVLLWFGWYGFNPGSVLLISTATLGRVASRAAVCTTLSGSAGGLAALLSAWFRNKSWDLVSVCNGTLCGFVSITCSCHVVEPWAAILIGASSALVFDGICALFLKLQIDDPLSASPMHAGTGAWGLFLLGLLAKKEYLQEAYGKSNSYGVFYGSNGKLLACQIIGIIVIAAWVCGLMGPFFFVLKVVGKLRISPEEEQAGLDVSKHGGSNYNHDAMGKADKTGFQV